jgi:hypothetical protein
MDLGFGLAQRVKDRQTVCFAPSLIVPRMILKICEGDGRGAAMG